jgi:hypothetical protein
VINISFIKGRTLNSAKEVQVYRNVNMEGFVYSIRQNGQVIGYSPDITLTQVKFHVNQKGRERVLSSGVKNVHAYIKGYIIDGENPELQKIRVNLTGIKVTYNPFTNTNSLPRSMRPQQNLVNGTPNSGNGNHRRSLNATAY